MIAAELAVARKLHFYVVLANVLLTNKKPILSEVKSQMSKKLAMKNLPQELKNSFTPSLAKSLFLLEESLQY